jgi:2-amino-4-hydroxy-6-hydroxymethyldihydropteridine diphosphokinase
VTRAVATRAWVALGSNLDDPCARVRAALAALGDLPHTRCLRRSHLYRSAPWGPVAQPDFVNAVAELETALPARALLDALLALERRHGRMRGAARWGPRRIDLDLLLHGDLVCNESGLALPHPRMSERAFVLAPMAELQPDLVVPGHGTIAQLLARVDRAGCTRLAPADCPHRIDRA